MALDLAQFHDAFFDESFEALDTMEAALLKLNVGAPEPEEDDEAEEKSSRGEKE